MIGPSESEDIGVIVSLLEAEETDRLTWPFGLGSAFCLTPGSVDRVEGNEGSILGGEPIRGRLTGLVAASEREEVGVGRPADLEETDKLRWPFLVDFVLRGLSPEGCVICKVGTGWGGKPAVQSTTVSSDRSGESEV